MTEPAQPPSAAAEPETLAKSSLPIFRRSQISHLERPIRWVWEGFLARGYVTLLTGQWKIGKTSLVAALLARLGAGGELAGRAVAPGRAIVITEEEATPWLYRMRRYEIGDAVGFVYNPFVRPPLARQWGFLLDDLDEYRRRHGLDLVVFDTLAALLPGSEEGSARAMTNALRPVRDLAANGVAVLLLHHPRKGSVAAGQAARGTGALPAAVDTILEYQWVSPATCGSRRRRLLTWSRHAGTAREVVLELAADGTTYTVVTPGAADLASGLARTLAGLVQAGPGRSVAELVAAWPPEDHRPVVGTVQAELRKLFAIGLVTRTGRGTRHSPHRYFWAG